uniref:Uncharacterized protein n=1 Tax=Setaria viridis TaxID=4556 RepID=A0A4U6U9U5_SETVI|nr:hypothetical protein SEVIR_5G048075v2 [Setaria viridis]
MIGKSMCAASWPGHPTHFTKLTKTCLLCLRTVLAFQQIKSNEVLDEDVQYFLQIQEIV